MVFFLVFFFRFYSDDVYVADERMTVTPCGQVGRRVYTPETYKKFGVYSYNVQSNDTAAVSKQATSITVNLGYVAGTRDRPT